MDSNSLSQNSIKAFIQDINSDNQSNLPILPQVLSVLTTICEQLESIKRSSELSSLLSKKYLNSSEAAKYLGIEVNSLYHINHLIGFTKPSGKLTFYSRESLDNFIQRNRIKSEDEVNQEALSYASKQKGGSI
jgi:hypothetical protein